MKTKVDITEPEQIRFHLQKISEQGTKLNIKIDDEPVSFGSIFIKVVSKEGEEGILIDILTPINGNVLIRKSKNVSISYSFEETNHTFNCEYLTMNSSKEFDSINVSVPTIVHIGKRRNAKRFTLSYLSPLKVDLGNKIIEEAGDISVGGLCFFTQRDEGEFFKGKTFSNISFTLPPKKHKIDTKAIVRWFAKDEIYSRRARNKCGIEFIRMNQVDKEPIAKYLSENNGKHPNDMQKIGLQKSQDHTTSEDELVEQLT